MLKSKILWAFILGVATSVGLLEAKINLGYSTVWTTVVEKLSVPGARLVDSLNTSGALMHDWTRFWTGLAFACNLLIYAFVWYVCIAIISSARARRHPYEHESSTLVPRSFR